MDLSISERNTKLGKVTNISLAPITTCRKDAPCIKECYARKAYCRWKSVQKAWDKNTQIALESLEKYFTYLDIHLRCHQPKKFRWHVSGDIISQDYFDGMKYIADQHKGTKFLAFTKMYELDFNYVPNNLSVVISKWPKFEVGVDAGNGIENLQCAWLSHDERLPDTYVKCPGNCEGCGKCWELLGLGLDVCFDLH